MPARLRPGVTIVLLHAAIAAVLLFASRDTTFVRDDWFFVLYRDGHDAQNLFEAHVGHPALLQVLTYLAIFEWAGLDDHWVFRVLSAALAVGCAALLYAAGRDRVGRGPAMGAAALVALFGAAWGTLLVAFGAGTLASTAFGLGALLVLDRRPAVAALLLTLSVAGGEVGLAFLVATAVQAGRPRLRTWWPVLLPLVLYAGWLAWLGAGQLPFSAGNLAETPAAMVDAAAEATGSLVGVPRLGIVLLVVGAFLVGRCVLAGEVPPRLAAALALGAAVWSMAALSGVPGTNARVMFPGAVAIVLIAFELSGGRRLPTRRHALVAATALLFALVASVAQLVEAGDGLRREAAQVRVELAAVEAAGARAAPSFVVPGILEREQMSVPAGAYLAAVARWGSSPAADLATVRSSPERDRRSADATLAAALRVKPEILPALPPVGERPDPERSAGALLNIETGCIAVQPVTARGTLDLPVPRRGLGIRVTPGAAVTVAVRRYAGGFSDPLAVSVPGGASAVLLIPAAGPGPGWHARVAGVQRFDVCNLR